MSGPEFKAGKRLGLTAKSFNTKDERTHRMLRGRSHERKINITQIGPASAVGKRTDFQGDGRFPNHEGKVHVIRNRVWCPYSTFNVAQLERPILRSPKCIEPKVLQNVGYSVERGDTSVRTNAFDYGDKRSYSVLFDPVASQRDGCSSAYILMHI
ncbi:hypothetical protein EVAR_25972_1 [Eumeta japonica]|uniref:Uncharacterized protein n=1 Tax=Eumeta variegata TaxID=151549 RepID=A0A4C1V2X8_EUMVA|nr:hypothetical protein EVAR_25972_1 [Eumeta japonica]